MGQSLSDTSTANDDREGWYATHWGKGRSRVGVKGVGYATHGGGIGRVWAGGAL